MLFIIKLLKIYSYIILARVILSWVQPHMRNQIVDFMYQITEPVLAPIRRMIPPIGGGLDISPAIAILLIYILIGML